MSSTAATSPMGLMVQLVEDADQLVRLQIDLGREEARQLARRNRGPAVLLVGGAALVGIALLVALPTLLTILLPWRWEVAAGWLVVYVVAGAIAIPVGRARMRLEMPQTGAMVKETEQWMLRQVRSFDVERPPAGAWRCGWPGFASTCCRS